MHELCALSPPFDAGNHLSLAIKVRMGGGVGGLRGEGTMWQGGGEMSVSLQASLRS